MYFIFAELYRIDKKMTNPNVKTAAWYLLLVLVEKQSETEHYLAVWTVLLPLKRVLNIIQLQ